jgi:hypothetical protein
VSTRLQVAQVYAFLRSHNALIVHFSSEAKGEVIDVQRRLPLDLRRVIGGKCKQVGLSCHWSSPVINLVCPVRMGRVM